MTTDIRLLVTVTLALICGGVLTPFSPVLYSPLFSYLLAFSPFWYPGWLPKVVALNFYLTILFASTLALMIAGVPAAIYERVAGLKTSDNISYGIWMAGLVGLLAANFL